MSKRICFSERQQKRAEHEVQMRAAQLLHEAERHATAPEQRGVTSYPTLLAKPQSV